MLLDLSLCHLHSQKVGHDSLGRPVSGLSATGGGDAGGEAAGVVGGEDAAGVRCLRMHMMLLTLGGWLVSGGEAAAVEAVDAGAAGVAEGGGV